MAAAVVVLGALVAWLVWPAEEPPRARQYRDTVACLLTDERGLAGPEAGAVWAGMQQASTETLVRVQYLQVDGAQTAQNAATYLGTLVQSRCSLIIAVGQAPVTALSAVAPRFPATQFIGVGSGRSGGNMSTMDGDAAALRKSSYSSVLRVAAE